VDGPIVSGFVQPALAEVGTDNFNLVAGAVDMTTTGLNSSIGADANGNTGQGGSLNLSTETGELTATTSDGSVYIDNGDSSLTIDSIVADQGGQAPVVNDDQVVYNTTPDQPTPTYSSGTSNVSISGSGPIILNSLSATGDVTITSSDYILEGNAKSPDIVAQEVDFTANGTANYLGQVTFANSTAGDTMTLPATGPTWSDLGFANGDPIFVSGASSSNVGAFTIASGSPNDSAFTIANVSATSSP
jgi:hypothetical protein